MPAKSKAQQRLFGMALAVRRGEMKRGEVNKEVLDLVDSDLFNRSFWENLQTVYTSFEQKKEYMKRIKLAF